VDIVLALVIIVLALGTLAGSIVPTLEVRFVAPDLDLALETITTIVALSIAALAWVRFRQLAEPMALFTASAFAILAIANGFSVMLVVAGLDEHSGMGLESPGQAPSYVFTVARLQAAVLLIGGAHLALRGRRPSRPAVIPAASVLATVVVIAGLEASSAWLPALVAAPGPGLLPQPTPAGAALQILVGGLFLWAAGLSRQLHRRDRCASHGLLAVGLVLAALAQAHAALYPSAYTGLVTGGDVLRLAFDLALLVGIEAEIAVALARLRASHAAIERVRSEDARRAVAEERAHLSRELHDGLAQDLWLAKLANGRLSALTGLGPEARALVREVDHALEAGLVEAREAVAALRTAGEPDGPMWDSIARYVDEFAHEAGLRAEVECPRGRSGLSPRAEAELLRIAQEALNNVRRHADATVIRVRAAAADGWLELVVGDNGRGFDPAAVGGRSFGLLSMRERASRIGGELTVDSRPRDGTRIRLLVPLEPRTSAMGASR
jgi:signal transduction histidine kinase